MTRTKGWLAQHFDDYVEEAVVGHRPWIIVLLFALGLPTLTTLVEVVFPAIYRPGTIAISLLIGVVVGVGLVLVARERQRYRAAAMDDTGDVAALRKKPWGEFEILVGQVFRSQGYVVKERGGQTLVGLEGNRGKGQGTVCRHKDPGLHGRVVSHMRPFH